MQGTLVLMALEALNLIAELRTQLNEHRSHNWYVFSTVHFEGKIGTLISYLNPGKFLIFFPLRILLCTSFHCPTPQHTHIVSLQQFPKKNALLGGLFFF